MKNTEDYNDEEKKVLTTGDLNLADCFDLFHHQRLVQNFSVHSLFILLLCVMQIIQRFC